MSHNTDTSFAMSNFSSELTVSALNPNIKSVWEINSEVESRLAGLCEYHKHKKNIEAEPNSGLSGYHNYLTDEGSLDLRSATTSLDRLRCLQNVLKYVAHGRPQSRRALECIDGIGFDGRQIVITDAFVQESLRHKETYLDAVKRG